MTSRPEIFSNFERMHQGILAKASTSSCERYPEMVLIFRQIVVIISKDLQNLRRAQPKQMYDLYS